MGHNLLRAVKCVFTSVVQRPDALDVPEYFHYDEFSGAFKASHHIRIGKNSFALSGVKVDLDTVDSGDVALSFNNIMLSQSDWQSLSRPARYYRDDFAARLVRGMMDGGAFGVEAYSDEEDSILVLRNVYPAAVFMALASDGLLSGENFDQIECLINQADGGDLSFASFDVGENKVSNVDFRSIDVN